MKAESQFTPAVERALRAASQWTDPAQADDLHPAAVLLGLLEEPECRAAAMLAAHGIDAASVHRQWPALRQEMAAEVHARIDPRRAPSVRLVVSEVEARLWAFPQPLLIATEHLLLGITASAGETSSWLADCGLADKDVEAEIQQLYGYDARPIDFDLPETLPVASGGGEASHAAVATEEQIDEIALGALAQGGLLPRVRLEEPAGVGFELTLDMYASETVSGDPQAANDLQLLRILDAAANRAREGLRVIEDFTRFALDDRFLTSELKQARHGLVAIVDELARGRLTARDTLGDIGTVLTTPSETQRADLAAVVAAAFARTTEALRSLEEFGKVLNASLAARFEPLRYRVYTLERAVATTATSLARLAAARLYVLVDGRASESEFEWIVAVLVRAGVHAIQLRDKRLEDAELMARARQLRQATRGTTTLAIINDRADVARIAEADGVHVGQEEISVRDARSVMGLGKLVGVSTHSLDQARRAVLDGADYIGVGPTFASQTKSFDDYPGLELLRAVAAEIRLPAFAIGGISAENIGDVLATGIGRVAVGSAIVEAADPPAAAEQILAELERTKV